MAALNLNANLPVYIQWPDDAALTLIQRRRAYQPLFTTTREMECAKVGYENLERLINRNPEGYPTRTPTLHDERFHQELSDEFWRVEPLVRAARRNRMDRRTYEYRERRRSRSRSPYYHRERRRSRSRSPYHRERGRSHRQSAILEKKYGITRLLLVIKT
ncbi:hypothetical protein GLOIN_2v1789989 [Rhizophagus irregularis DAOM 181602=DAOM 197198]|nr:hypothetical protein GLOIN_2v1789989 [Rhizophagus irregularis DAOM 181602=DAOM 197198]